MVSLPSPTTVPAAYLLSPFLSYSFKLCSRLIAVGLDDNPIKSVVVRRKSDLIKKNKNEKCGIIDL